MFGVDFRGSTPEEITAEIAEIQSASKLRMLFAADEEGGTVVRISKYPQYRAEPFPAQAEVLSQGLDAVSSEAQEIAGLMSSMGLNMNLAPVCDLPRSETDFIYDRAFSTDPQQTSRAVGAAVESYGQSGLICALKHFPGYGNNLDTHTGISIDERPLSEITELDLEPFRAGISAGAPVVMVSHNIVNCIDDSLPGSLSGKMYAFLREQGFTGAAMTDDLSMGVLRGKRGGSHGAESRSGHHVLHRLRFRGGGSDGGGGIRRDTGGTNRRSGHKGAAAETHLRNNRIKEVYYEILHI